jgi:streptogramin lyase
VAVRRLALAVVAAGAVASAQDLDLALDLGSGSSSDVELAPDGSLGLRPIEEAAHLVHVATLSGAAADEGTLVRLDARTGRVLGEYRLAPEGHPSAPLRTTVDGQGNAWVGGSDPERQLGRGSVVKIGVVVGGTRVRADGTPDPAGEYLAPPFEHCTAVDRDGDGLIRTSRGLGDVLAWPDNGDGQGSIGRAPALVEDALDECILVLQRTETPMVRHLTVDPGGHVWAGDLPGGGLVRIDGQSGARLEVQPGVGGTDGAFDADGRLWLANSVDGRLTRLDPTGVAPPLVLAVTGSQGLAVGRGDRVWNSQRDLDAVTCVATDGTVLVDSLQVPGAVGLRDLATARDGSVWVASSGNDRLLRLDPDGHPVGAPISVGRTPVGVDLDALGRVWTTCRGSEEVLRVTPTEDGGVVDRVVALRPGSRPMGYGRVAGQVGRDRYAPSGVWRATTDSGVEGTLWSSVSWEADTPFGTTLLVMARAADREEDLVGLPWTTVPSAGAPLDLRGRHIEVYLRLGIRPENPATPRVFGVTVQGTLGCQEWHRRRAGSLLLFPEVDGAPGKVTVLTVTNVDHMEQTRVKFVYVDGEDCTPFSRVETLTPNDTLSLLTSAHAPTPGLTGFAYLFAVEGTAAIVHDGLIGQSLILDGFDGADHAINAVAFLGLGTGGWTDLDGDEACDLDGLEYTPAPDELLIPRFFGQQPAVGVESRLVLVALSGGILFDTTVDLLVYNDNEEVFSAEHTFHCWERTPLLEISGVFGAAFLRTATGHDPLEVLGAPTVETGWFRVQGAVASSSSSDIPDPAVYAVLTDRVAGSLGAADLPFERCSRTTGALLEAGVIYGD